MYSFYFLARTRLVTSIPGIFQSLARIASQFLRGGFIEKNYILALGIGNEPLKWANYSLIKFLFKILSETFSELPVSNDHQSQNFGGTDNSYSLFLMKRNANVLRKRIIIIIM